MLLFPSPTKHLMAVLNHPEWNAIRDTAFWEIKSTLCFATFFQLLTKNSLVHKDITRTETCHIFNPFTDTKAIHTPLLRDKINLKKGKPVKLETKKKKTTPNKIPSHAGLSPIYAKIGIFYTIFYGVLAALVAICMWVFFQTLDPRIPKWKLEKSIIGTNPGLGFRPLPPEDNVESTLIWYKGTDYENYKIWTEALTSFLAVYKTPGLTPGRGQNIYNCKYTSPPPPGQVCDVNIKDFDVCTQENNYSYHKSSPCVFLKLNKIYGWIPEYYNQSTALPDKMPKNLKEYIEKQDQLELNTIWVSCEGENPADVENIGPVEYYPRRGFPGYYYPYENSEGYLSPLVAVHFARPVRGIIINIECKAWAKNIIHDRKEKLGSVHFELLID